MDKDHKKYGSLTPLGKLQAKKVGNRLSQHNISIIHVSNMLRAKETGELIFDKLKSPRRRNCKLIVEGIPSLPEKLVREKKIKKTQLGKTKTRMNKAFKKYFTPYQGKGEKHEALICHGNIIRYFVTKALGVDTRKWINLDIYQCSISTISIDSDGKFKLLTFGEIGHIPPEKRTHL
ncbi:MAG: histidine phosphatase family protein [Bdellovibrionales bacterium]|nr:histidine phosphatase family protein [Bdellovibrionales bacterium]